MPKKPTYRELEQKVRELEKQAARHAPAAPDLPDYKAWPLPNNCLAVFLENITMRERKQAEQALRESEESFHGLFDIMPSGVAVCESVDDGQDFILKDFNRAAEQIEKVARKDVIGRRITEVFPGVERFGLLQVFKRVLLSGRPEFFPEAVYSDERDAGSWRENWVFKLPSGNIVAVYNDISKRKQAEMELQESEQKFRLLAETINDVFWISSCNVGTMIYVSPAYETLWQRSRESLYQSPESFLDAVHPDDLQAFLGVIDRYHKNGEPYEYEYRIIRSGGEVRWINERGFPLSNSVDGDQLMAGVCTDITDRKLAEEEKARLIARIQQAQKMEAMGRLAGGVAHDYNNMLSVIIGNAELAMEKTDRQQPLHTYIEEIFTAAMHSRDITRQLLAFARKQTIVPRLLDLNETVEGLLKMLRRLIGEDIDLAWLPGPGLWPLRLDPAQIAQILANLCLNARDAITGAGQITIETENASFDETYCADHGECTPGDYVMLAVSDDGCGMEPEVLANVFEPFFTTKDMGRGTGLGMSTVLGIVKQNAGFINIYSEPDRGTTFKIYLPQNVDKTIQPEDEDVVEPTAGGDETVLLVEDEVAILKLGRRMLETLGYTVLDAALPGDALGLAEKYTGAIQLLITDVIMPEMNGRDLAARLQASRPDLKILYMSGYTADTIAHRGVLNTGVHFIQKPFTKTTLAKKIREVLD